MDIRNYLRQKNIKYREIRRNSGTQAVFPCPSCGDKNFSINLDSGIFSCFKKNKCGVSGGLYKFQKLLGDEPKKILTDSNLENFKPPVEKFDDPDNDIKDFFEKRKIDFKKTQEHFRYMKLGNRIAFRYFDYGEHVATKYRSLDKKDFSNDPGTRPSLYNIDNCRDHDTLHICEGEMDCIALYSHTGIDAVSVPNGTGDTRWIETCWEDIESFKQIVFIFDRDKAGQEAVHKLSTRLGSYKCSNVILPYNDINECIIKGMSSEELCQKIFSAQDIAQSQIRSCKDFTQDIIDDLADPDRLRGLQLDGWKTMMRYLNGVRKPELTVITGQNHAGKTTFINEMIIALLKTGEIPTVISLEMPAKNYLRWMLMQSLPATGPLKPEQVEKILDKLSERLYIIDIEGRAEPDKLLDHIDIACRKYGATQIFVDSLMKIRLDRRDLLGSQIKFVDDFIDIIKTYSVHGWLVAHPRKGAADSDRIGKVDVGGAGHITDAANNVLALWRPDPKQKEDIRAEMGIAPSSILSVKKCREFGTMGDVFLGFNDQNKKLFELDVQPKSY